jgi:uncharacterized membrane protein
MKKYPLPLAVLALCYALFFTYLFGTYSSLPPRVASHFGIDGRPNGWMSRNEIVDFMLGLGILLPAFIVGMMAGAGRIPVSFVNLPHRDYWLAPERRRSTAAILLTYALWFACMNVLFIFGLQWLIVQANANPQAPHLSGLGISLVAGGFLLGTLVWSLLLIRRFSDLPPT